MTLTRNLIYLVTYLATKPVCYRPLIAPCRHSPYCEFLLEWHDFDFRLSSDLLLSAPLLLPPPYSSFMTKVL